MSSKPDALRFVTGMALYWPFFIHQLFTPELLAGSDIYGALPHHAVVLATVALCLGAASFAQRKALSSEGRGPVALLVPCSVILCLLVLAGFSVVETPPRWLALLCPVAQGAAIASATLGWAERAAAFDRGTVAVLLALSMTLAQAVNAAAVSLGGALSTPDSLWCMLFPSASCLLLLPVRNTESGRYPDGAGAVSGTRAPRSWLVMLGVLALYLFGTGVFRSSFIAQTGVPSPVFEPLQRAIVLALSLTLVVYAEFGCRRKREPYPWVLFGFACLAILYFVLVGRQFFPTACSVIVLHSRLIAVFLMWAAAEHYARDSRQSPLALAALFLIPQTLVRSISVTPGVIWDAPWAPLLLEISLIATAFFMTVGVFWWVRLRGAERQAALPRHDEGTGCLAAREAQGRYGLTDRERDVLELLACGYAQKSIANELGLSLNSVRTYAKTLYLKLGVHSRQEVIELMRAHKAERGIESQP